MANKGKHVNVAQASLEALRQASAERGSAPICPRGHPYPEQRFGKARQRRCLECKRAYEREFNKSRRASEKQCQTDTSSTEIPPTASASETKPSSSGQSNGQS